MALVYFNSLERQSLNRGCISPASRNREILEKSIFLQDFWISAAGGETHFTASRGNLIDPELAGVKIDAPKEEKPKRRRTTSRTKKADTTTPTANDVE